MGFILAAVGDSFDFLTGPFAAFLDG